MNPTVALILGLLGCMATARVLAEPMSNARPAAETLALACAGCHGTNGHSLGSTPTIAGKPVAEFVGMMSDFKSRRRRSSIMNRIAAGYKDADFAALAQHFATR